MKFSRGVRIQAAVVSALIIAVVHSGAQDFTLKRHVTHTIAPSRFVSKGSGSYFIEFPRAAFATVDITITATGNQTVNLNFGEKKSGDAVNTRPGADLIYKSERLSVTSGTKTYRVTQHPTWRDDRGRRDILFPVIPFRYVDVSNCPGTLTEADINQIAVTYPFNDDASSFTSSNSTLNEVWDLCKYTMKACSWVDMYVDGRRERAPYEADGYIQMLGHYCQDTQAYGIARNTFTHLLTHPEWPAEWLFHSIYAAYDEYMWTGDKSFISSNYSALQYKALEKYARSDGLIHPTGSGFNPETPIVDWPSQYRDGYQFGTYASSLNAQHYKALVMMGKIASALGKSSDASSYESKAKKVYNSFNSVYWTGSTYKDNPSSSHTAIHAAAYALDAEIVPADRIASVANHVKSRGQVAGVYGSQYVVEGLYKAGEEDHALSLMTSKTNGRSWYGMISAGSTITTEAFDPNYGDWNHAWGGAPANLIPRCLMGIDPIEPGFKKIQIKPQIGTLTSASVTIPTIKGPVSVSVTKGTTYKITVDIPSGATAKVYVKDYHSVGTTVTVDGVSQNGTAEGKYVIFDNVSSGTHTFEMGAVAILSEIKTQMVNNVSNSILRVAGNTSCRIPEQWRQCADAVMIFNCRGVALGEENIVGKNSISGISMQRRYGYGIFFIKPLLKK